MPWSWLDLWSLCLKKNGNPNGNFRAYIPTVSQGPAGALSLLKIKQHFPWLAFNCDWGGRKQTKSGRYSQSWHLHVWGSWSNYSWSKWVLMFAGFLPRIPGGEVDRQGVRWSPATLEDLKKCKCVNFILKETSSSSSYVFICPGSSWRLWSGRLQVSRLYKAQK